jgi:hypothetical protein
MVLIPLFQCEISPPATRGFLVSQHGEAKAIISFMLRHINEFIRCCACLRVLCSRLGWVWFFLLHQSGFSMALSALSSMLMAIGYALSHTLDT